MKLHQPIALFCTLFSCPGYADDLRHPSSLNSFCADPGREELCPDFPDDQTDFSDKFVYMFINVETQTPFDVFSWQAFVSLNWPELNQNPDEAETSWRDFSRREEVFGTDIAMEKCGAVAGGAEVITSNLVQADGNVLIDQNRNFIVYETRINSVAEDYILAELLNTQSGQLNRENIPISFPQGRIGTDATPASILIKTSWQILTPESDVSQFIAKNGLIHIPAKYSANGMDMCLHEKLGLVGMHVVARIHSGNGDEWLWTTFEHKMTAPTAGNHRRVNQIFSRDLFPGGCATPKEEISQNFMFFNADFPERLPNQSPAASWKWAENQPYARIDGSADFAPPQIVRCWEIFEGTSELNEMWQSELKGTPLENYNLISTQWRGADKSPMFEHGEVPRFLTNTTLETYLQAESEGTCLGCHASAETEAGQDANFTFLFQNLPEE